MPTVGASHSDVLVVGGGLMGLASALALARTGASVTCLDAGGFGNHQSSQNWGFARQQGRDEAELPLMRKANEGWQGLSDDLGMDIGWVQGGNLAVFDSQQDEENYRAWVTTGRQYGIDTREVGPRDIQGIIPSWQRQVRGGIFAPEDGHANPHRVVEGYLRACERAGVLLYGYKPVERLVRRGSRITGAATEGQVYSADKTIISAGAWSRKLLSTVGINLPQNFVVGTVALTSPAPRELETTVWGPGFSFRQRTDGRYVCAVGGGGVVRVGVDAVVQARLFFPAFIKNRRRFKVRPSWQVRKEISSLVGGARAARESGPPEALVHKSEPPRALRELKGAIAGTDNLVIEDSWAGIIDSTPDGLPVIDPEPGPDGLIVATGFSGHGYGLVPAIGPLVAELGQGKPASSDLAAFTLGRFSAQHYKTPDAVL